MTDPALPKFNNLQADLLDESNSICRVLQHDKKKLEIAITYPFDTDHDQFKIDAYFFVPKMVAHGTKLTARQFVSRFQNLQRMEGTVLGKSHFDSQGKLNHFSLKNPEDSVIDEEFINEIKAYTCELDSKLKDHVTTLEQSQSKEEGSLDDLAGWLNRFQLFVNDAKGSEFYSTHEDNILMLIEYLSNRFDILVSNLLRRISKTTSNEVRIVKLKKLLIQSKELQIALGIPTMSNNLNRAEIEYVYYRQGIIKKYIYEALYLGKVITSKDKIFHNLVAMFGASLAAVWAGMAEYQRLKIAANQDTLINFVPLIFIGVVAYVLKDRLKDVSKEVIKDKLSRFLPDLQGVLTLRNSYLLRKTKSIKVADFKENVKKFKLRELPDDIQELRTTQIDTSAPEPSKKEEVFHYQKTIQFHPLSKLNDISFNGVKDIWRMDLGKFLSKFDDPQKKIHFFDSESGLEKIKVAKTYHFNLILRVSTIKNKTETAISLERHRMVLNQDGLMRVEKVS